LNVIGALFFLFFTLSRILDMGLNLEGYSAAYMRLCFRFLL